jgi:hypothetical protein
MRPAATALALVALLAQTALIQDAWSQGVGAQDANMAAQNLTLALPHPLGAGETAFIEIALGAISKGRVVTITTADGQPLGTVAPFGARPAQTGETYNYTLPVPAAAIHNGRVAIRVTISQPGGPPRAPTAQEVRAVKLGIGGAKP